MADVFLKIGQSESLSSEGVVTAGSGAKYNLTEQGTDMLREVDELLKDAVSTTACQDCSGWAAFSHRWALCCRWLRCRGRRCRRRGS